ncbi:IPP transferase-domain-containing protein [Zopfochytrium polystomum]|nr:IPP transferase-domain-containing protein [Zopfochytrium polystomum]
MRLVQKFLRSTPSYLFVPRAQSNFPKFNQYSRPAAKHFQQIAVASVASPSALLLTAPRRRILAQHQSARSSFSSMANEPEPTAGAAELPRNAATGLTVFVVIGTTGVGKSLFAIELAKSVRRRDYQRRFNADSEYSVIQFERDALEKIRDIHNRGKVPILVGGTHYYVQAAIWDSSLVGGKTASENGEIAPGLVDRGNEAHPSIPTEVASKLQAALAGNRFQRECRCSGRAFNSFYARSSSTIMAERWHPNEWRKIRRSLQVYLQTGRPHSEILSNQKDEGGGRLRLKPSRELRWNTGVFWLWAENESLDPRLDSRVDQMIQQGLFDEIRDMRKRVRTGQIVGATVDSNGGEAQLQIDYTRGIMQAIGFKEFDPYLSLIEQSGAEEDPLATKLKVEGLESMKSATRRQRHKQELVITRGSATRVLHLELISVAQFEPITDVSEWKQQVQEIGVQIATGWFVMIYWRLARSFLTSKFYQDFLSTGVAPPTTPLTLSLLRTNEGDATGQQSPAPVMPARFGSSTNTDWARRECHICVDPATGKPPRVLHGAREWAIHISGSKHKRRVKGAAAARARASELANAQAVRVAVEGGENTGLSWSGTSLISSYLFPLL